MELPAEISVPVKHRRQHSPQFKAQVLEEIRQPGVSTAAVARRHQLNANLIHKWRRDALSGNSTLPATPAFIPLSAPLAPEHSFSSEVRLELPSARGPVKLFWPCDQPGSLAEFLKHFS